MIHVTKAIQNLFIMTQDVNDFLFESQENDFLTMMIFIIQDIDQYQKPQEDSNAADEIEDEYPAVLEEAFNISTMYSPSHQPSLIFSDTSEAVPHQRSSTVNRLSKFVLAIDLWCENTEVFRTQYTVLQKILQMLESHSELFQLSDSLKILKQHTKTDLSLLTMHWKQVSLVSEKLSTKWADSKSQDLTATSSEDLYFFDPQHLFQMLLSSLHVVSKMHIDITEF